MNTQQLNQWAVAETHGSLICVIFVATQSTVLCRNSINMSLRQLAHRPRPAHSLGAMLVFRPRTPAQEKNHNIKKLKNKTYHGIVYIYILLVTSPWSSPWICSFRCPSHPGSVPHAAKKAYNKNNKFARVTICASFASCSLFGLLLLKDLGLSSDSLF